MSEIKVGKIVVIRGSMFSGKTEELVRRLRREKYRPNGKAQAFKPSFDTRYATNAIVTHDKIEFPCTPVSCIKCDLLDALEDDTTLVGIDEGQFCNPKQPTDLYETCINIARTGRDVWVACLSQDYRGKPFENVAYLLAIANKVIERTAVCSQCGSDEAIYSHKVSEEPVERLVLGEKNIFDARCADCFVPQI